MALPVDLVEELMSSSLASRPTVHVVEVGGSSVQSTVLGEGAALKFVDGPHQAHDAEVFGLTAPGLVVGGRVRGPPSWGGTTWRHGGSWATGDAPRCR